MQIQQRIDAIYTLANSRQRGFSLVELLVALALSSILLVGLFQIFNSNRQAFGLQDGMARVQESGRITMEILSREFRVAGYMGCATSGGGFDNFTNHVNAAGYDEAEYQSAIAGFGGDNGLVGYDNVTDTTGTPLANIGLTVGTGTGQVISGTDVVTIQGVKACEGGKVVSGNANNANIKIESSAACGLEKNDIVIVSNCNTAEAFSIINNQNTGTPPASGDTIAHGLGGLNLVNKLNGNYDDESYIFKPSFTAFYVGNGASGEPALFMQSLTHSGISSNFGAFEIAEGIEDMQLLYGEDTNDDGMVNAYVRADQVTDFNAVLAVRSRILARSQDRVASTAQTYRFNDATVTAGDLRMRTPYETTNAIRNRLK